MTGIQNPAGAFGYPSPETPDGDHVDHYVLAGTVAAGNAVALTGTLGKVIAQLTNGSHQHFVGVAIESGVSGDIILVSRAGAVTASKHAGAALTSGDMVTRSVTTAGQFAVLTVATAVTQAKDVRAIMGVVLEDAGSAATTVIIDVRGY